MTEQTLVCNACALLLQLSQVWVGAVPEGSACSSTNGGEQGPQLQMLQVRSWCFEVWPMLELHLYVLRAAAHTQLVTS